MNKKSNYLLGVGYTGERLIKKASNWIGTSRSNQELLYFDLNDESSWDNIKSPERIIITFPVTNEDLALRFYEQVLSNAEQCILYGSTSCYLAKEDMVNEESPLDFSKERVKCEEILREKGITILSLSGISGDNRTPISWLRKGLIKNGLKKVNLINVEDIIDITLNLIYNKNVIGQRINITDGKSPTWESINMHLGEKFSFPEMSPTGKEVSNKKLLEIFGNYTFKPTY